MRNSRRKQVEQGLQLVRTEIGMLADEKNKLEHVVQAQTTKNTSDLTRIAHVEHRVEQVQAKLLSIITSLSDTRSEKMLLLDATHFLALQAMLIELTDALHAEIHLTFWGKVRGRITASLNRGHIDTEHLEIQKAMQIIDKLSATYKQLRNEFIVLSQALAHKEQLAHKRLADAQNLEEEHGPRTILYHATAHPDIFRKQPIQLQTNTFYLASSAEDAKQLGMGSLSHLHIVKFMFSKKIEHVVLRPTDVQTYAAVRSKHAFCIPKDKIATTNEFLRLGRIHAELLN